MSEALSGTFLTFFTLATFAVAQVAAKHQLSLKMNDFRRLGHCKSLSVGNEKPLLCCCGHDDTSCL